MVPVSSASSSCRRLVTSSAPPPVVEPSGLAAARAIAPGVVGPGAQRAQRLVECSAAQRSDLAAPGAAAPPLLAREAPGLVGGLGDHARCGPPADRARQHGVRDALATQRSVGCSNLHRSTSTALGACFAVGGIGDQAVSAQRSPVLVADRGFADRPAPATGLGAGFGGAVAAQPLRVDSPVQVDDSTAARAGWGTIAFAPASHRVSIRRSTDLIGASAPAPVSSSGRSCSAQAS